MKFRLTPREDSFYDLFTSMAQILTQGASQLAELLASPAALRPELNENLHVTEHEADEIVHAVMRKVNATFVTPIDREDIQRLVSALDDCMDFMEEAGDLVVMYKVTHLPSGVLEQAQILQRAAELTVEAMPRLRELEQLSDYWIEINRLENQADKLFRRLTADLFEHEDDAKEILKLSAVFKVLEAAADSFETVANIVETIAAKES